MRYLATMAAAMLAGCAVIGNPFETGEQIAAREGLEDYAYCRSYAIEPGTPLMAECLAARQHVRRQEELLIALRNSTPFGYTANTQRLRCAGYVSGLGPTTYVDLDCR